ncbi:MAG TPA: hypothetical protein VEW42_03520 [Candidatus Eisenbacteria bacterium]|nr:hypothetical protein [Candidatus Eisenbacteria bacterium]
MSDLFEGAVRPDPSRELLPNTTTPVLRAIMTRDGGQHYLEEDFGHVPGGSTQKRRVRITPIPAGQDTVRPL